MAKQSVTIDDISRLAEVSKTTVSRFLNGKYEYMSEKTRARIESIIAELNYRPNQIARSLKTKRSNLIAVISQGIATQTCHIFLQGFEEALQNTPYDYIVLSSGNDYHRECKNIERCIDQQVAAIGLSAVSLNLSHAIAANESGMPVVLFDRYTSKWPYSAVYINHRDLVFRAMDHLRERGYEDILLISYQASGLDNRYIRELAFREYQQKLFGTVDDDSVFRVGEGIDISESLRNRIKAFAEKETGHRKAILAANMRLLHMIVRSCRELNLKYPDDFGLCGYDSWELSRLMSPTITYLDQPQYQEGYATGKLLLDVINSKDHKRKQIIELHGTINIGESTQ